MEVQGLLDPLLIELTAQQDAVLDSQALLLSELGFAIESFGQRTCLLRAVPAVLGDGNPNENLRALLDSFNYPEDASLNYEQTMALSLACHSAIRAGQVLSLEEMKELVRQLEVTASPRTCPHGRPTVVLLSSSQLEREFGRR